MSNKFQEKANEIFKQFPKTDEVFVTSDVQGFLSENRANLHAKTLKNGSVKSFQKEIKETSNDEPVELTVKQLEEFARDASDIPALEQMLVKEKVKGENARKGAVSALETRIKTLKEQA